MITIRYQNQTTGEAWDITSIAQAPRWSTTRVGTPATLTFEAIAETEVDWALGGSLSLRDDDAGLFYGFIVRIERSDQGMLGITAYDQLFWLVQNADTYVIDGLRADEVVQLIADDFELTTGELANTGYIIPLMVEDGTTLIDIILKALDLTLINSGQLFTLWDDHGFLRVTAATEQVLELVIGDESLASGYTYSEDIDTETANRIKLVRDNEETLKRDVWVVEDTATQALWGILQHHESVDEGLNHAQVVERAEMLLELKNRPMRSFQISAIADLRVRAGVTLFVNIAELEISQLFLVDEVKQDLEAGTMEIRLRIL